MSRLNPEENLFIDGAPVPAQSGETYDVINPATEEVVGIVAAASAADGDRALAAARRCFDETDWSTNTARRARALRQFGDGLKAVADEWRHQIVAESGSSISLTYGPAARQQPGRDRLHPQAARNLSVQARDRGHGRHGWPRPTSGPQGGRRRGRGDHALERAGADQPAEDRPGAGRRLRSGAQGLARHTLVGHDAWPRGRAVPRPGAWRAQHPDVVGRRRSRRHAHRRPPLQSAHVVGPWSLPPRDGVRRGALLGKAEQSSVG